MAEAFLSDRLARRGVDAEVHSAGLLRAGAPASEYGVAVLRGVGLDLSGHRSTTMEAAMLERADLVIGMAREHVRAAVVEAPTVWPRAFTLKELVRRGAEVGTRPPGQPFEEWLQKCHAGRLTSDLLGDAAVDDVADPIGLPRAVYERTAAELSDLVDRLVDLAFPPRQETADGP
jgi:protein-tyrosine phosphatase